MPLRYATKCIKLCKSLGNVQRCVTTCPAAADYQHARRDIRDMPRVYYGGRHTVTLLPGAGIGPELTDYVKEVFKFAGVPVDFEQIDISCREDNDDLDYAITSIRRNGIALKGNIEVNTGGDPDSSEVLSANVLLRKELDLYVNAVRCRSYPGVPSRHCNIDTVIIRQNTEGEYAMLEHEAVEGVVESMKVISQANADRIVRYAFEYARAYGRKKITTVHKANIMKLSDGLFLRKAREVALEYPDIHHSDMIVDNACMQLVANPHQFDMILTTNLYGSVISNVLCGLLGGAGLFSGKNVGESHVIFEPATRSTGSLIAGKNVANPIAMLRAAVDMLECLGRRQHADLIGDAIEASVCQGVCTRDLGGEATSREVVDCIMRNIEAAGSNRI